MVRRTFWMVVGAGLGVWMVLKLQAAAEKMTPTGALQVARRRVRHVGNDLRAALDEGRRVKQATEADLRQQARSRPAIEAAARTALPSGDPSEEQRLHR